MMGFDELPPLPLTLLWVLWFLQALWCWYNAAAYSHRVNRTDQRAHRATQRGVAYTPPAAVIVAVKGADERFERHMTTLRHQQYPRYRIIFVVESESDPAHEAVRRVQSEWVAEHSGCESITLLIAGRAEHASGVGAGGGGASGGGGGQKVHNLVYAVRSLRETDEAVVFADADVTPDEHWMRRLIEPLRHEHIGATTGYRWLVPAGGERSNWPTQIASVINASIATLQGPPRRTHAWGGSTAIRRATLDEANLLEYWHGALSDDYQLTRAIKRAGKQVRFIPRLLVPTPVRFTWTSLLEFGRRQYLITRVHAPLIWLVGMLATLVYTAGWASVILAILTQPDGWVWGVIAAGAVCLADYFAADTGAGSAQQLFDDSTLRKLRRAFRIDRFATPVIMAVHLTIILASGLGRRITWAGITYRLRGRRNVVIERRRE